TVSMSLLKLINGNIITSQRIISNGSILIENGKIKQVSEGDIDAPAAQVIDAQGNYVSPGFIDIHVHGGGGHDFMDGSVESFLKIAETHAMYGTTSMVPTTLTSDEAGLLNTLSIYESADSQNTKGAKFLGMHLEGPYFAMSQRG